MFFYSSSFITIHLDYKIIEKKIQNMTERLFVLCYTVLQIFFYIYIFFNSDVNILHLWTNLKNFVFKQSIYCLNCKKSLTWFFLYEYVW